jgi:hypothetical protein
MLFKKIIGIYFSSHVERRNTVWVTQCFLVLQRLVQTDARVL